VSATKPPEIEAFRRLLKRVEPATWLFAGDSITHGALHTFGARDYTEHFTERLRWEMGRRRDCVIKTGVSGWTVATMLDDIQWSLLRHKPDAVSLMFGMNDCVAGAPGLGEFRRGYRELVRRVRGECGAAIAVHTLNRVLPTDAERFPHAAAYVDVVREVAAEAGAVLIDHWAHWENVYVYYWLSDAIHPGDIGHRVLAHLMFRELEMWDEKSDTCRLFVPRASAT